MKHTDKDGHMDKHESKIKDKNRTNINMEVKRE